MKDRKGDFEQWVDRAMQIPGVKDYVNSFSVIIGDLVRSRRLQLGWTHQELANRAGTTQARISIIEAGEEDVKMHTVDKVMRALGLVSIIPNFRDEEAAAREAGMVT
jgi:ribosome-binding protein aMBF1 (putative translation factor)